MDKGNSRYEGQGYWYFYVIRTKFTLVLFIKCIAEMGMEIISVQDALINCKNARFHTFVKKWSVYDYLNMEGVMISENQFFE